MYVMFHSMSIALTVTAVAMHVLIEWCARTRPLTAGSLLSIDDLPLPGAFYAFNDGVRHGPSVSGPIFVLFWGPLVGFTTDEYASAPLISFQH